MGLSDIAAGLSVTTEQDERGVAVVDATDAPLAERLAPFAEQLPCDAAPAATVVERYADGADVAGAARAAGLAPVMGAKTLHLLGEPVSPLSPVGREVVRDWLAARLSRSEALELADAGETAFALAAFVETHEPLDGAREALEGVLEPDRTASVAKRDALAGTLADADDGR